MNAEYELKLDLEVPKDAELLAEALELGAPAVTRLHSVYFDTPDLKLAALGYTLRIRQEGCKRIQTLKASDGAHAGLFVRPEWEEPARGRVPRLRANSPVVAALGARTAELGPCMEVEVTRSVWTIEHERAVIEMAVDCGEVRANDSTAPFCEIELELKDGDVVGLFALARRIGRLAQVRLGVLSKAERGQRLIKPPSDSDKARPIQLAPDMSAGDAFRAIAHDCLRQYRLNETRLLAGDNGKALHQARVALRRLRTAILVFRPIVDGGQARRLTADLRWLAGRLGPARNIDVLIPRVRSKAVQARLGGARASAYAAARRAMTSDLTRELMIDLVEWLSVGKWMLRKHGRKLREAPLGDYAPGAIGGFHDRLMAEREAVAGPDDEMRHEARKTAKKLRYTVAFFASLYWTGKLRKGRMRYLAALEELQDELGALNDLAVLPAVLATLGVGAEQAEGALRDGKERDFHISRAADTMRMVAEADRFWE